VIARSDVVPARIVRVPAEAERTAEAIAILDGFARRTGLRGGRSVRYLWTDAFAVHALLALGERTGERRWPSLAAHLIDEVHAVLGRRRTADGSLGDWLAGSAEIAREHPTRGGLRIGKPLHEREPGETLDPELEWERDGQYFHYLVWWMRALDRAAIALRRPELLRWATELAAAAHGAFAHGAPGARRLFWKMSVRLDRPLVPSSGQHDALDAVVTYAELERARAGTSAPSLAAELGDASAMLDPRLWATADPLGIGGLLLDAQRALALERAGSWPRADLVDAMMEAARTGLRALPTDFLSIPSGASRSASSGWRSACERSPANGRSRGRACSRATPGISSTRSRPLCRWRTPSSASGSVRGAAPRGSGDPIARSTR
jgi:hypothetical protein